MGDVFHPLEVDTHVGGDETLGGRFDAEVFEATALDERAEEGTSVSSSDMETRREGV